MKVIFLKTVPLVAEAGDVKEVSQGYARNYLLPKRLAVAATPEELRRAEAARSQREKKQEKTHGAEQHLAAQLEGKTLRHTAKATDDGKLFAAVHPADIAALIKDQLGAIVAADLIEIPETIKRIGQHQVTVRAAGRAVALQLEILAHA